MQDAESFESRERFPQTKYITCGDAPERYSRKMRSSDCDVYTLDRIPRCVHIMAALTLRAAIPGTSRCQARLKIEGGPSALMLVLKLRVCTALKQAI